VQEQLMQLVEHAMTGAYANVLLLLLQFVFMDMGSYEETRLPRDDWAKYLKEGAICYLVFYQSKVST
jgi:hypothetical protein